MRTDSRACVGTVQRKGVGKIKHLEVKQLWVQEKVYRGKLKPAKTPRANNPSDALTHHWNRVEGERHLKDIGVEWRHFDRLAS